MTIGKAEARFSILSCIYDIILLEIPGWAEKKILTGEMTF
jgi:hypothetical protein